METEGAKRGYGKWGATLCATLLLSVTAWGAIPAQAQTVPGRDGQSLTVGRSAAASGLLSVPLMRAVLLAQLVFRGRAAKLGAILKHGYNFKFTAPSAGTLSIGGYLVPVGAHLSSTPKPILLARGAHSFTAYGPATVTLRLTAKGKRVLKHATHLALTIKGVFTQAGGQPVSTVHTFSLSR